MPESILAQVEIETSPELPIQVEIVNGAVYVNGFDDRQGVLETALLTFSFEALVQAFVLDFDGFGGVAGLTSTLAVEFTPGTVAPDFEATMISGQGESSGAFLASFGSGFPFAYYPASSSPQEITDLAQVTDQPSFEIEFGATGLNTPLLNGAPTFASTPVNYFLATATMVYSYSAFQYGNGANTVTGDAAGNFVNLGGGNDWFDGGAGNDTVIGGTGDDRLKGGEGSDTADYSVATSGVSVYLQYSGRDVGGGQGRDRLSDIENITGSEHDDRLVGDDQDNVLTGGAGNDLIKGKDGHDTGRGGAGADRILLGDGNDRGDGGDGIDILSGYAGNDTLNGDGGDDFLYGGLGADIMDGGDGADRMRGNRNDDQISGGAGNDILRGGGGNDTLSGDDGNDWIDGENGDDRIQGGKGTDVMTGGAGADIFVFTNYGPGSDPDNDRVKDFDVGIDKIDLTEFFAFDFEDVLGALTDTTDGVLVSGDEETLLLEGVTISQLSAADFILT